MGQIKFRVYMGPIIAGKEPDWIVDFWDDKEGKWVAHTLTVQEAWELSYLLQGKLPVVPERRKR